MRMPKRYGESRIESCPWCGKQATTKNKQQLPVCQDHQMEMLEGMKCACGQWLDLLDGKWGPYFRCMRCGNISWNKAMEVNPKPRPKVNVAPESDKKKYMKSGVKETTVDSNNPMYFD